MEKLYKTGVNLPNKVPTDELPSPTVAVFAIDEATAKFIGQLAVLVVENNMAEFEAIRPGATFYLDDPAEKGTDYPNKVVTDVSYLRVASTHFWFSALCLPSEGQAATGEQPISRHTDLLARRAKAKDEVCTDKQPIPELLSHFGLSLPAPDQV